MGIFDSLDSDGEDERDRPRNHWLRDWLVQLPVNKQGQLKGDADQAWPPHRSNAPHYRIDGRTLRFRKPGGPGAKTGGSKSTRCELNQLKTWSDGKIQFDVEVEKTSPTGTIILQCRSGADAHELIQLRAYKDQGVCKVQMNENKDKWTDIPVDWSGPVRVKAEVKRNRTIRLWVGGKRFEADMHLKTYGPRRFNFKLGVYGGGENEAACKVTGLKWS